MPIALGVRGLGAGPVGALWTPALPLPVSGLLPEHWYRSDQGLWQDAGVTPAVNDGDVVGRWEDISTNADHVNQANAGNKPTLQNGAGDLLNGHPVVRFDGIDDYLQGTFTTGGNMLQPNTMILVAALDAAAVNDGVNHKITDGIALDSRAVTGQTATPNPDAWYIYSGAALNGNASDSNWHIWTALYAGVTSQLWINGISNAGPANAGVHTLTGLTVGTAYDGANPWDGDITEVILYNANLSDADKNTVGQYLATRYSLTYTDI